MVMSFKHENDITDRRAACGRRAAVYLLSVPGADRGM